MVAVPTPSTLRAAVATKARLDRAYAAGKPLATDRQYDAFLRAAQVRWSSSEELRAAGHEGGGRGLARERLPILVGSLTTRRPSELAAWMGDVEREGGRQTGWLVEPKFDGVSATLRYLGGEMTRAWSRGKVVAGESMGYDVTAAMRRVQGAAAHLKAASIYPVGDEWLVRGEVVMHRSIFRRHYADRAGGEGRAYRNARNMVAGLLSRSDPEEVATDLPRCTFVALQLFHRSRDGKTWVRPYSAHREWVYLMQMGFTIALDPTRYSRGHFALKRLVREGHPLGHTLPVRETGGSIGELAYWDHHPSEAEVVERMRRIHAVVDIQCDGIVVQPLNNRPFQARGQQLDPCPGFMRAVKLDVQNQESHEGVVGKIEWNVSKRGLLKPRLILARGIETESATIDHATCNNARFVAKWDLRPGRRLKMIRSGDVIPRIVAVWALQPMAGAEKTHARGKWVPLQVRGKTKRGIERMIDGPGIADVGRSKILPTKCPDCGTRLQWTEVDLYCGNEACPARHGKSVASFFKLLGVDDVAEKTVLHLMENGMTTVAEIVRGATPQRLAKLEGYAERKARLVSDAVRGAMRDVPLSKVMHASCCFHDETASLGSTRLQAIVAHLGEGAIARASRNEIRRGLAGMPGVGPRIVDMFVDGLPAWRKFYAEIAAYHSAPSGPKTLTDTRACWTGFRDEAAAKYLVARGGQVKGSVSKDCTVLFCGDTGSAKAKKADAMRITVVPQAEMWAWLKARGEGKRK